MKQSSSLLRLFRHLLSGPWITRRCFPKPVLAEIEAAVRHCESRHPGEIRFVVEGSLALPDLIDRLSPRQRAIELFSQLRVWDTEHNNGVLIYVLLADRDVEIVADRGIASSLVAQAEWEACCRVMEVRFAASDFAGGAIAGIEAVAEVLARHPPDRAAHQFDAGNEMPDAPIVL